MKVIKYILTRLPKVPLFLYAIIHYYLSRGWRTRRIVRLSEISREEAESAVPLQDCSGRPYRLNEREDLIRFVLLGAEMQRGDIVFKTNTSTSVGIRRG